MLTIAAGLLSSGAADAAPPVTPPPVTSPSVTSPPGSTPTDLQAAVARDLGLSWDDYLERGRQAEQAAVLDERLSDTPGYLGVTVEADGVVVTGTGPAVDEAASTGGVRVERPVRRLDEKSADRLFTQQVDAGRSGLLAIGWTGDGWLITVADPDVRGRLADGSAGRTPREFAAANPGLSLRRGELADPQVDILGGEGWGGLTEMPRCSIGFAAFGPDGRQAMLTAGHCSDDGAIREARWELDPTYSLGVLAFTQFGSAGDAVGGAGNPGTDLSAYAGAHPDLRAGLAGYPGVMRVTGTTAPVAGAPVCTSGRTTRAWRCATIETVGPYAVRGPGGDYDIRWVDGFSARLATSSGDSGAGAVTGLKAVGMVSAGGVHGGVDYSFLSTLTPLLQRGFSLETWLNAPAAAPAVAGRVRGQIAVDDSLPPDTTVRLETTDGARIAPVVSDGTFDIEAPSGQGRIVTASGHSRSVAVDFDPRYGSALSGRYCGLRDAGCFQVFTGGSVYWSRASGEHAVRGRIFDRWGAAGWENGSLGYPTSPEMCGLVGGGCWQTYQGGRIYWSPDVDAHPVRGAIGEAWNRTGYENGILGYPTSEEACGLLDGGCFQRYQHGSFYWSPRTGAHWVRGLISDEWGRRGGETGRLGYPVSGEDCGLVAGVWTCTQHFAGGTLTWTAAGRVRD